MIGYKLFRKRKDGSYGPLFINKAQKLFIGEEYIAECHPTKGYTERPGWHVCKRPHAPHLTMNKRVWCVVSFTHRETIKRPAHQGGIWYLGSDIEIIRELTDQDVARILNNDLLVKV